VIAEAGVNHNGSLETAVKMVDVAASAGSDAVKFQTFTAERVVASGAAKAKYQIRNTKDSGSQLEMLKKLELPASAFNELSSYCKKKNILFMSTPFDPQSADMLDGIGMKIFKIPSGELTNKPLIEHIANIRKPIILSTGMSYLEEVLAAVRWIKKAWKRDFPRGFYLGPLVLMHCISSYPAKTIELNLAVLSTLRKRTGLPVGFSDHSMGGIMSIAAAGMGASAIEKHFTLSRSLPGPDHKASLEPGELKQMISDLRAVECALGDGVRRPSTDEKETMLIARRSIVAAVPIRKGEVISRSKLDFKRPGTGISPADLDKVIGKRAKNDFSPDELIKL